MKTRNLALAISLILATTLFSQYAAQDSIALAMMKKDVTYLAHDRLQGREAGTKGEEMAAQYIANRMETVGLTPNGDPNSYYQKFNFKESPVVEHSALTLDGATLKYEEAFYPISGSGNGSLEAEVIYLDFGIHAPDLGLDNYKKKKVAGKIAIVELGDPEGAHPHSKYIKVNDVSSKIAAAEDAGAIGLVFLNSKEQVDDPDERLTKYTKASSIPVVFLKGKYADLGFGKGSKMKMEVTITQEERTAMNVIGYMDNEAEFTVVVGAHFDHLGFGIEGTLHRGEDGAIHNGADDNASGVAAMIQIADDLKKHGPKSNNYMFIAFSGEEKGLLGSNYFMKNPTGEPGAFNYMLNMDMVGRMDSTEHALAINAVGTSPAWAVLDSIEVDSIRIKTTESGVGPSDHTSFYLKDIPVLHFFSGTHADYHKPSDDEHLINYAGMLSIVRYMEEVITRMDKREKLEFTKTKDQDNESAPRFTVTLGVVPDYLYDGEGMKIDGITDGKPASVAGLEVGDVVVKLGDHDVKDMMGYMKALGMFKKGDATTVEVIRKKEVVKADIQF